ncbi:WD40-repeat-containing domain protein [Chiua virens]|nr:WD40-repeat-containing domain protein [Chiua virens]
MFSVLRRVLARRMRGELNESDAGSEERPNRDGRGKVTGDAIPTLTHQDSAATLRVMQKEERPNQDDDGEVTEDVILMTTHQNRAATLKVIEIDGRGSIWSVVFTADGKCVLAGGEEGKIQCWGRDDGQEVRVPMDAGSWIYDIAVSQDGKCIVSGGSGGMARVFDAERGEIATELTGHGMTVYAVDVSLDGKKIATGSYDKTARIWSFPNGEELLKLKHDGTVIAVTFSPNGLLLATAAWDVSRVRILDCHSGRRRAKFKITLSSPYNQSIAWHHDSTHLFVASQDSHVHHLDASTGNTLSKWRIHSDRDPRCITLASDSAFIAASAGRAVLFWDAVTHKQIGSSIQHSAYVSSMAISTNNVLATSADNAITVRSLRDILPIHYCDNTTRNLRTDLTDLYRRYQMQSRKLRQIAALKAELDRRKRSVAVKTDKLAAVRRELDRFPDLSHEVIFTRNELKWFEARFHSVHQRYHDNRRDITSTVASSQSVSATIHQYASDSDASAKNGMIRALEELNNAVQQTSVFISTYITNRIKSPDMEERSSAARRASNSIPQSLVHHLQTMPRHDLPCYLPIALRAFLTSYLYLIISSWTRDKGMDRFIASIYDRVRESESQMFATGHSWRSLTSTNIPVSTENSDTLVPHVMQCLSDIVVAAGCAASASDIQSKMSPKFWCNILSIISTAEKLRDSIGGALAADFKVALAHPGQALDRNRMVVDHQTGLRMPARGMVLCTTRLGLIKKVVGESPHAVQNNVLTVSTIIKPAVVLQEIGRESTPRIHHCCIPISKVPLYTRVSDLDMKMYRVDTLTFFQAAAMSLRYYS